MPLLPWKKRDLQRQLSAYVDGELDAHEVPSIGEHLVLDRQSRETLADYARTDALVTDALGPATRPDSQAFADTLMATLHSAQAPMAAARRVNPAVWASVGILVTAGLTFAGLKQRGWI
jgi:anti-sigma factor RsiW